MHPSEMPENLKEFYLFKHLSPEEYARLLQCSVKKTVPGETVIWSRGDMIEYIVVLLKGTLKITLLDPMGNEFSIRHILPIDSLGDATIIHNRGQMADVVSVEKSELLYVNKKKILTILETNCRASFALSTELSRRINNLTRELELQVFSRSRLKIMYKLLQLKLPDSAEIKVTHQQLAELVGMTREKLTLALEELKEEGYIDKTRGKITIRNPAALAREVEASILGL